MTAEPLHGALENHSVRASLAIRPPVYRQMWLRTKLALTSGVRKVDRRATGVTCAKPEPIARSTRYFVCFVGDAFAVLLLLQPWKREKSPAFHASRRPGALRSQSGRISLIASRRSCQRSAIDGRPQNQ
jgi:hypothetical protein